MQSINPMISQLNQRNLSNSPQMQQIKNLMNTVRAAKDPQFALNQLMSNNPRLQQAMLLVQTMGGNPEQAFYTYAKQMGVDPNEVLNTIKSL